MILAGKTEELGEKPATLSTTNPTWIDPDANPGLRCKRPATNRLSHGTAYKWQVVRFKGQKLNRMCHLQSFTWDKLNWTQSRPKENLSVGGIYHTLANKWGVTCEISGSHGGEYNDDSLLSYSPISIITLMVETVRISETSVYFNETTRHCIPEGCIIRDITSLWETKRIYSRH
jgi:hypothetical protein